MDIKALLTNLKNIADAADSIAPILTASGIPGVGQAVAIAGAAMEIAESLKAAIDRHQVIGSTSDQEQLEMIIAQLKSRANDLAAQIEAS